MCEVSVIGGVGVMCVRCVMVVCDMSLSGTACPIHRRAATHGKRLFPPRLWTCLQVGGLASTGY